MTDTTQVNLVIGGVLMPFIIALINQAHWSAKLKGVVAFLACLAAAAVVEALRHRLTWDDWRPTAEVIVGAALAMYKWLWGPTASGLAPAIESATTVTGSRASTSGRHSA